MNRSLLPCLGWLGLIALALPAHGNECQKSKSCEKVKCEKVCTTSAATVCTSSAAAVATPVTVAAPAVRAAPAPCPAPSSIGGVQCNTAATAACPAPSKPSCCTPAAGAAARVTKCGSASPSTVQYSSGDGTVIAVGALPSGQAVLVRQPARNAEGGAQSRAREAGTPSDEGGLKSFLRRILDSDRDDADHEVADEVDEMDFDDGSTEEDEAPCDADEDDEAPEPEVAWEADDACGMKGLAALERLRELDMSGDHDDHADHDDDSDDEDDADEVEFAEFADLSELWTPETFEALSALNGVNGELQAIDLKELAEHYAMNADDVRRIQEHAQQQAEMAEKYVHEALKAAKHAGQGKEHKAAMEQARQALQDAARVARDGQLRALESLRESGVRRPKCAPPRAAIRNNTAARERDGDLERRVSELEALMRQRGQVRDDNHGNNHGNNHGDDDEGDDDGDRSLEERVERLERALRNDPDDFVRHTRTPATRMRVPGLPVVAVVTPDGMRVQVPEPPEAAPPAPPEPAQPFSFTRIPGGSFENNAAMKFKAPTVWKAPTAFKLPRTPAPPAAPRAPRTAREPSAPSAPSSPHEHDDEVRRDARAKLERLMKGMHAEVQSLRDEMLRLRRELEEIPETMSESDSGAR